MDNEEYIYNEEVDESESSSYSRKKPAKSNTLDKGKELVKKAKDGSLKENVNQIKQGIGNIKSGDLKSGVGNIMDGSSPFRDKGKIENTGSDIKNAGNALQKTGDAAEKLGRNLKNASNAGEKINKTAENAAKANKIAGKGMETAGKATEAAGRVMDAAGKATSAGGKAASTAGDAINAAGLAADATGVGAVAGVPMNVVGSIASAGGKAADAAGTAEQAAGQATIAAGQAEQAVGKAQQAGAKAAEVGAKAGGLGSKFGKKFGSALEQGGKKAKETGEAVKEFGKKVETVGKYTTSVLKTITNPVKMFFIIMAIFIFCILIFFSAILEPLMGAMDEVKTAADVNEKFNNFILGLGFENSIDAFRGELSFLDKHYDTALDEPLLMATLFYDDSLYDKNVLDSETSLLNNLVDSNRSFWGVIYSAVDYYCDEALTETDEMGRVYSANKIFRLKELTKHMVEKTGTNTSSLRDYINYNTDIIGTDVNVLDKSSYSLAGYPTTLLAILLKMIIRDAILKGANSIGLASGTATSAIFSFNPAIGLIVSSEVNGAVADATMRLINTPLLTIDSIENQYLENMLQNNYDSLKNYAGNIDILIYDLLSAFTDIVNIELEVTINDDYPITISVGEDGLEFDSGSITDLINAIVDNDIDNFDIDIDCNIEYETYELNLSNYESYLKEHYIREMPEFKDYIYDKDGNIIEERINEIYENIVLLAETWREINEESGSALNNNVCIGNIHPTLIDQLHLPIDLEEGTEVNFSTTTAFGVSKNGSMHNGVDLNEESTGTTVGAPVYAIYNGTVISSTASGDYTDSIVNGGWLKISHTLSYTNDKGENVDTTIYSVYGGLDPMSVPTTGTTVSIGQQIGVVGAAVYSEDNKIPGLHFGIIDSLTNEYLNPINVFITCSAYSNSGTGICYYDSSGGLIVEIPDNIVNYNQMNYSVTCYNDYGWVLSCKNPTRISSSSLQNRVHKLWVADGARYKNGIAVLNVNGVDRYLVATTQKFGASGELINATLQNGETIPMVIADTKSYSHTGVINDKQCNIPLINDPGCYGHFNSSTNTLSVLEFEVDPNEYNNNPNGKSPGAWGQEWDTTQKVESITRYGSLLDSSINVGEICDNNYVDPSISNDPGELINANGIINQRLDLFLEKKGSSIDLYNNSVIDAIKNHGGYCTRTGSIAAAKELINYIGRYDAKLPYTCGGGWGSRITGPQANWGSHYSTPHCNTNCGSKCYIQDGLDCAGFVRWVLNTAGYNIPAMAANDFNENNLPGAVDVPLANTQVLQPGDIMYSSGHVVFVIGVNESAHKYIIAEAAGLDSGVQFSTKSFTATDYTGVKMSGFYNESTNCIH